MKKFILVLAIAGCAGGQSSEDTCIFDGDYEMGLVPTNGCAYLGGDTYTFHHVEGECSSSLSQLKTSDMYGVTGFMSCGQGDPVVECEGFASRSDGCTYTSYIRKVVK